MQFKDFIALEDAWRTLLIHVNPGDEIEDLAWANDGVYTNLWWVSYTVGTPNMVTEDGKPYAECFTLADADAEVGTFYYDFINQKLYLHTFTTKNPGKVVTLTDPPQPPPPGDDAAMLTFLQFFQPSAAALPVVTIEAFTAWTLPADQKLALNNSFLAATSMQINPYGTCGGGGRLDIGTWHEAMEQPSNLQNGRLTLYKDANNWVKYRITGSERHNHVTNFYLALVAYKGSVAIGNVVTVKYAQVGDDGATDSVTPLIVGSYQFCIIANSWRYITNAQYADAPISFRREEDRLIDGGFEEWTSESPSVLDWWSPVVAGTSSINREVDPAKTYEGGSCLRLDIDGSNSLASVEQTFTTAPGMPCKLDLRYRMSASSKTAKIIIKDSAANVYLQSDGSWSASPASISLGNALVWTEYTLSFLAHNSYANYIILLTNDSAASASIYFDAMKLTLYREDNYYLPYLTTATLPVIEQGVSEYHIGAIKFQFGDLQFINDGWWYQQLKDYYWHFAEVEVLYGAKNSEFADFASVFTGVLRHPQTTNLLAKFNITDNKIFTIADVPPRKFWQTDYPLMADNLEGAAIPVIYGEHIGIQPTRLDTLWFKLCEHPLEDITAVYKADALLTITTDYTLDLANGEIWLVADPGDATITCDVKGKKCKIQDGTYSTNIADILCDLLVNYCGYEKYEIDYKSFIDLQIGRSQAHAVYINNSKPLLEVLRDLMGSALFNVIPLTNGKLAAIRYKEGTDSLTPVLMDEDFTDFTLDYDTTSLYRTVQIGYDRSPLNDIYVATIGITPAVAWRYGEQTTFLLVTTLKTKADADGLKTYYQAILQEPLRKIHGTVGSKLFNLAPGEKVIISRTRVMENGTTYTILDSVPYRVLDLQKNLQTGRVTIDAVEDIQSTGSGAYCESCYTCQACNSLQGGTCGTCYSCQACVSGQCTACQTCNYCQYCNAGQCATCQSCYACEKCNAGQCASCQTCNVCEKCNVGQCSTCQLCDTCQACVSGQCASCQNCDTCQSSQCAVCVTCQKCNTAQCSACQACNTCQYCNTGQCSSCQSCNACESCNTGQCATCQLCNSCQKCNAGQYTSCQTCNSCQVCNTCQSSQCASCQACNTCQYCNTGQCSSCQNCDSCQKCNAGQASSCQVCNTCQQCVSGQCGSCQICNTCQTCNICQLCNRGEA